jgi:Phage phiEco32-like COOH.NH2 ligase-type 2
MPQILIGCDPEIFLRNPNSKLFLSAHGMCPGDKHNPYPVTNGTVQVDGMALEIGIHPASTENEFVNNIKSVWDEMRLLVDNAYEFVACPTAHFEPAYFENEVPKFAKDLGCEPDYNAYTELFNPRPKGDRPFRTGAGHIHIGWTDGETAQNRQHFDLCVAMARQMDYYLGIYSLLWDKDDQRRTLYGKAGAFRVKPYGMEYRTLSNAWLNSELLMRWVYRAAYKGASDLLNNKTDIPSFMGDLAQDIINNNETEWYKTCEIDTGLTMPPALKAIA